MVLRQFPDGKPIWGDVHFLMERNAKEYDWLVVYHDLPGKNIHSYETLECSRERTILVTHEPSAIKAYGKKFSSQFGVVLTCHQSWALSHSYQIKMQPGSCWMYESALCNPKEQEEYPYNSLQASLPPKKSKSFSTICSDKKMKHTLHHKRWNFTQRLQTEMPEMDRFGRGVKPLNRKADALDPYRYHLTIENQICPHYWTEKLADAFLGWTLPFYCGCPNAATYFPEESFIPIDIDDFDGTLHTIKSAMRNKEYEKRLPAITEARRRILEEHNLYAMLARTIKELSGEIPSFPPPPTKKERIYSRYALMKRKPHHIPYYLWEKIRNRFQIFD